MDPNQNFITNGPGLPGSPNWNAFIARFSLIMGQMPDSVRAIVCDAIEQNGNINNSRAWMEQLFELVDTLRIESAMNQCEDTIPETKEDEEETEEMQEKEDNKETEEMEDKENEEIEEMQEKENNGETEEMQDKQNDEEIEEMQEKEDDESGNETDIDDDLSSLCIAESENVAEEDAPPDPCGDQSKTDKSCCDPTKTDKTCCDPTKTDKTCGDRTKTDGKKDVEGNCSTHCSKTTVSKKDSKTDEKTSDDKSQAGGDKRKADEDANAKPSKIARTSQGNLRDGSSSNNLLSSVNFNGNIISFGENVLWPMQFFGASRIVISPPNREELQGENRSSGRVSVTTLNNQMRIRVLGELIVIQLREGINSDDVGVSLDQNGLIEIAFPINDTI